MYDHINSQFLNAHLNTVSTLILDGHYFGMLYHPDGFQCNDTMHVCSFHSCCGTHAHIEPQVV